MRNNSFTNDETAPTEYTTTTRTAEVNTMPTNVTKLRLIHHFHQQVQLIVTINLILKIQRKQTVWEPGVWSRRFFCGVRVGFSDMMVSDSKILFRLRNPGSNGSVSPGIIVVSILQK